MQWTLWFSLAGASMTAAAGGAAAAALAYWLLTSAGPGGTLLAPVTAHQLFGCLLLAMSVCALATVPAARNVL